jgi:hypothetical protein
MVRMGTTACWPPGEEFAVDRLVASLNLATFRCWRDTDRRLCSSVTGATTPQRNSSARVAGRDFLAALLTTH